MFRTDRAWMPVLDGKDQTVSNFPMVSHVDIIRQWATPLEAKAVSAEILKSPLVMPATEVKTIARAVLALCDGLVESHDMIVRQTKALNDAAELVRMIREMSAAELILFAKGGGK